MVEVVEWAEQIAAWFAEDRRVAEEVLLKSGEVPPMFGLRTRAGRLMPMAATWGGVDDKRRVLTIVRAMAIEVLRTLDRVKRGLE